MKYVTFTAIFLLVACNTTNKEPKEFTLPSAYQFCIDYPDHEECQP